MCPSTLVYSDHMTSCQRTCRFIGQTDYSCGVDFVPVDGCGCDADTYMNENGKCVKAEECPCYDSNTVVQPGDVISKDGTTW